MTNPRRQYPPEYKQEAVGMAQQSDQPISHTAQNLGISDGLLRRWIKEQSNTAKKPFTGQGNPRDEELSRLKKELVDVKRERGFLREAAAYFAKQSK